MLKSIEINTRLARVTIFGAGDRGVIYCIRRVAPRSSESGRTGNREIIAGKEDERFTR